MMEADIELTAHFLATAPMLLIFTKDEIHPQCLFYGNESWMLINYITVTIRQLILNLGSNTEELKGIGKKSSVGDNSKRVTNTDMIS